MKIGKKNKTLLGFALFVSFALTDIDLHEFIGLYLAGMILIGLGIWLRKWRDSLEFYHRVKRAIYTIGFLSLVIGIFWLMHRLDNLDFGFMVGLCTILVGLLIFVKIKYHIVEFHDLSRQQKRHEDFVMKNYNFHYLLFVDWVLSKPKYADAGNKLAVADSKRNIGKGQKERLFEKIFPLMMLTVIILLATGVLK